MKLIVRDNSIIFKRVIVFTIILTLILSSTVALLISGKSAQAAFVPKDMYSLPVPDPNENEAAQLQYVTESGDHYALYRGYSDASYELYHFNPQHQLVKTIEVLSCTQTGNSLMPTGLTVDEQGSMYISGAQLSTREGGWYEDSCVQKFTSAGEEVEEYRIGTFQEAVFYTGIVSNQDGSIYLAEKDDYWATDTRVRILSNDGQSLGNLRNESGGSNIPLPDRTLPMVAYEDVLYVGVYRGSDPAAIEKYDFEGNYLGMIQLPGQGSIGSVAIDQQGFIYVLVLAGSSTAINQYTPDGTYVGGVSTSSLGEGLQYLNPTASFFFGFNSTDQALQGATVDFGIRYGPVIDVVELGDTSASIAIGVDERESLLASDEELTVTYMVIKNEVLLITYGSQVYTGSPLVLNIEELQPAQSYLLLASITDNNGGSIEDKITFTTTGVPETGSVTHAQTEIYNNKKILRVTGQGFGFFLDALSTSKVSLNNVALPFCMDGLNGTPEQYATQYPLEMIGVEPPCYLIAQNDATEIVYSPTEVLVLLPENFDMNSRGTVSVNGSSAYTFNDSAVSPVTPTIETEAGASLENTPQLPQKPVFVGMATPGATVKVVIHSDPVECVTTAGSNGVWRCEFTTALPAGAHTVNVQVTNPDMTVINLPSYPIMVVEQSAPEQPFSPGEDSTKNPSSNRTPRSARVAMITPDGVAVVAEDQATVSIQNNDDLAVNQPESSQNEPESPIDTSANYWWMWVIGGVLALIAIIGVVALVRRSKTNV